MYLSSNCSTTDIYTLSLHDALPIYGVRELADVPAEEAADAAEKRGQREVAAGARIEELPECGTERSQGDQSAVSLRSEEHTSELQSLRHLVCRLLLEKKNIKSQHRS